MQASGLAVRAAVRDRLSVWVLALCAPAPTPTPSQAKRETTWCNETHRQVRGSSALPALSPNRLGDQVWPYSGRIEFVQSDREVLGNSNMPVGLSRHLTSGRDMVNNAGMRGNWDIEAYVELSCFSTYALPAQLRVNKLPTKRRGYGKTLT